MKKLLIIGSTFALGLCAVGIAVGGQAKEAKATEANEAVSALLADYAASAQYTKKSQIFLNADAIEEFDTYFHAGHSVLERSTYYDETTDALLMGNYDGTFSSIKSGYIKNGANMDHYRYTGTGASTDDLFTAKSVDYTVKNTSPNTYFVNLSTLAAETDEKTGWISYEANGATVYQYEVGAITITGGEYNDSTLKKFQYFAAPMLLQTGYFSYKYIEVADAGDFLSIRIYLTSSDSEKVTVAARGSDYMLCEARVYKGLSFDPGEKYYLVGSAKGDWGETSEYPLEYCMDSAHIIQFKVDADFSAGETFKIRRGSTWVGNEQLEGDTGWFEGSGTDIKARFTGTGTIYYKPLLTANAVWASKTTATEAIIGFYVDATNKGDITSWGGAVYIVGDFCEWKSTDDNAVLLADQGEKKWYGTAVWTVGETYTYKIRLNNAAGTWGDSGNWYPENNNLSIKVEYPTTINITY